MDICQRLRSGHRYSGIVDPFDEEAAVEIERLRTALKNIIANIPWAEQIALEALRSEQGK